MADRKPYETTVTARIRVTVDIPLSQPWSSDVTFAEVDERARREAIDELCAKLPNVAIIGVPEVTAITTRRKT